MGARSVLEMSRTRAAEIKPKSRVLLGRVGLPHFFAAPRLGVLAGLFEHPGLDRRGHLEVEVVGRDIFDEDLRHVGVVDLKGVNRAQTSGCKPRSAPGKHGSGVGGWRVTGGWWWWDGWWSCHRSTSPVSAPDKYGYEAEHITRCVWGGIALRNP